jgi:hypothetical protein
MERISNGRNLARLARRLALVAAVATIGAVGLGAAPASADDGWHRGREAYRAQQLRQREWREHAWRAH